MIDIHVHILPEMDDGPSSMEEALEMARIAVKDGIRTIVAAPHSLNGLYVNRRQKIISACAEFNTALKNHSIPLSVLPGCEARMSPEILDELQSGRLMTINDTGRYFFLELPDQFIAQTVINLTDHLTDRDVTPILAHPERNASIQHNVKFLSDFVSAGGLCQVTGRSLTGEFGPHALKCCKRIIRLNMVHFLASDAHSLKSRPPRLSGAFLKLSSIIGKTKAESMLYDAPQVILNGS